ncbi:hypothetical protein BU16DRAFT_535541 [Lophium mytilinum]|uniref:Ecp2 effector protein domain-containing protein n=1 Tax=Lophium mytilinum TaxID=390894 RepID=A0A6A6R6M7_9PEZI|nr:hypothetical protein BU16DRAFT_535541 [Lophium mytilinum]
MHSLHVLLIASLFACFTTSNPIGIVLPPPTQPHPTNQRKDSECYNSGLGQYAWKEARGFLPTVCNYLVNLNGNPVLENSGSRMACRTFAETNVDKHGNLVHDSNSMKAYWFKVGLVKEHSLETLRKDDCVNMMGKIFEKCSPGDKGGHGGNVYDDGKVFQYDITTKRIRMDSPTTHCNMDWESDGSMVMEPDPYVSNG